MVNDLSSRLPFYQLPQCGEINPLPFSDAANFDPDKRGLVRLWEPPRRAAKYVMGVDASGGLINWSRHHRTDDDLTTDNGSIEIIRCGDGRMTPDVQVAEYFAPIDAEDLADLAVLLGRLYCGNSESGECTAIIEIWPGPGLLTQRRMMNNFGYTNFFHQEYLDSPVPKASNSYGWSSNTKTLQLLWSSFSKHLGRKLLHPRGQLLVELADLHNVIGKTFPEPTGNMVHDDCVRAAATAVWAAHYWSMSEAIPEPQKIGADKKHVNLQATDCSAEDMADIWEEMWQELAGEG